MRAEIKDGVCRIYDVTPQAIRAEPQGAAAAAVLQSVQYIEQRIETVTADKPTPQEIGAIPASERGKPWGVADLGGDGKLWIHHRPPPPSAQEVGAVSITERGKPWGLAELGGDGKLWIGHRPPPPSPQEVGAIPAAYVGVPWGIAELGGDGKVRADQLPDFAKMIEPLYPVSAVILWGFGRVLAGNSFGPGSLSTNSQLNRYATQLPAQLNDEVEVTFLLKSGYYRLELWGMRNSQQGIFQIFLNDSQLGSDIDRYAASAGPVTHTFNVSLSETKVQRLRTKVVGRNASSVGFQLWISALLVYPIL